MFGRCHHGGHRAAQFHPFFNGGFRRPKHNVPMNIIENEDNFEVRVYAVGFDKANIKISVTDDVLYISGTRELTESPNFNRQEFPVKSFERMLNLNHKVDITQITATQIDGVLIVTLPKSPEAKASSQEINVM